MQIMEQFGKCKQGRVFKCIFQDFPSIKYLEFKTMIKRQYLALILMFLALLSLSESLETGSCARFSLDGQKCEQCISNFHLESGECYMDILGCKQYMFGNICRVCQNGYILVNNLCCDERCMARIMRRHTSDSKTEVISVHFETLSVIIPYLQKHNVKGALSSLVQIDHESFVDVDRYIFLYEFYSGGFSRKRAVVDFVTGTKQIINVDWRQLLDNQDFLAFPKQKVDSSDYNSILSEFSSIYQSQTLAKETLLIKRYKFANINEFEVVSEDVEKNKIYVRTLYRFQNKTLTLINTERQLSRFEPFEVKYDSQEAIESREKSSDLFRRAVQFVRNDPQYHPNCQLVVERATTEQVTHFVIYVENKQQSTQFFVDYIAAENQFNIVDLQVQKKQIKVPQIKIPKSEIETKILKEIEVQDQQLKDFELTDVLRDSFQSFNEVTVIGKCHDNIYECYFTQKDGELEYNGKEKVKQIARDDKGQIIPQKKEKSNVCSEDMVKYLNKQKPKTAGQTVLSCTSVKFPRGKRITVIVRLETSEVEYTLKQKAEEYTIVQEKIIKENLPVVSDEVKQIVKQIKNEKAQKKEHKEIIEKIKQDIEKDKKEENVNSEQPCEQEKAEEQRFLKFIKKHQSEFEKPEVLKIFKRKFVTYIEITILIRIRLVYKYFFVREQVGSEQLIYSGVQTRDHPTMRENEYVVCNLDKPLKKIEILPSVLETLHQKHPETKGKAILLTRVREFPSQKRYIIVVRLQTEKREYVLLQKQNQIQVIEWRVVEEELPELQISPEKQEEVAEVVQTIAEQVQSQKHHKCEIEFTEKQKLEREQQIQRILREKHPNAEKIEILQTSVSKALPNHEKHSFQIQIVVKIENPISEEQTIAKEEIEFVYFDQGYDGRIKLVDSEKVKNLQIDENGRYVSPHPERIIKPNEATEIIKKIHTEHPITGKEGNTVEKVTLKQYPSFKEYTVYIKEDGQDSVYKCRQNDKGIKIIDFDQKHSHQIVVEEKLIDSETTIPEIAEEVREDLTKTEVQNKELDEQKNNKKSKLWQFIKSKIEDLKDDEVEVKEIFNKDVSKDQQQITVLVKEKEVFRYIFIEKASDNFTYCGSHRTDQPEMNQETGNYIIPNPETIINEKDVPTALEKLEQIYSQIEGKPIISVHQRVFPGKKRFTIIVRLKIEKVKYVLSENDGQEITVVEREVLNTGLKPLTSEEEDIIQVKKQTEESIIKEQREQKQDNKIQKERKEEQQKQKKVKNWQKIIAAIRQKIPEAESVEVKKTWERKPFKTFREIVVLVRQNQKFHYAYLTEEVQTEKTTFIGLQSNVQPEINEKGQYKQPYNEIKVHSEEAQPVIDFVNEADPTTKSFIVLKTVKREFPQWTRYILIFRQKTSTVQFIVIRKNKKYQIVETNPYEIDLEALSEQQEQQIEKIEQVEAELEILDSKEPKNKTEVVINKKDEKKDYQKQPKQQKEQNITEPKLFEQRIEQKLEKLYEQVKEIISKPNEKFTHCEVVEVWEKKFNDTKEVTTLVKQTDHQYHYVYYTVDEKGNVKHLGDEKTKEPLTDENGDHIVPNKEEKQSKKDHSKLISYLEHQRPETKEKKIVKIESRKFPLQKRYRVVVLLDSWEIKYVIEEENGEYRLINEVQIKKNLTKKQNNPEKKEEDEKEGEIEKIIEDLAQIKKNSKVPTESIHRDEKEVQDCLTHIKGEEPELNNNQTEVVKAWVSKPAKTCDEVTLLIKTIKGYEYCYLKKDKQKNKLQYQGKKSVEQPEINDKTNQYKCPNTYEERNEKEGTSVIKVINEKYPETNGKTIKSLKSRELPRQYRHIIIIRLQYVIVKYVVSEVNHHIQIESEQIIQQDLEPLTEKEKAEEGIVKIITEDLQKDSKNQDYQSQEKACAQNQHKLKEKQLINFIKQHKKDHQNSKVLQIFERQFQSLTEITVLSELDSKFHYDYIQKEKQSGQLVYLGHEQRDQATVENDKYTICNKDQNVKKAELNPIIIQTLNKQRPETKEKAILLTTVRQFPTKKRYIIVIRLATEKKQYLLTEDEKGIRIVEEKVTEKDLPERQNSKAIEQKVAEVVRDVIQDVKHEQTQICQEDREKNPSEKQFLKVIRETYPQAEQIKVLKEWKDDRLKTYNEVTLLVETDGKHVEYYFQEEKRTKKVKYNGKKAVEKVKKDQQGNYLPTNPEKYISKQEAKEFLDQIHKEHPITKNEKINIKEIRVRQFPEQTRCTITIVSDSEKLQYTLLKTKNKEGIEIVEYDESSNHQGPVDKVDLQLEKSLSQIQEAIKEKIINKQAKQVKEQNQTKETKEARETKETKKIDQIVQEVSKEVLKEQKEQKESEKGVQGKSNEQKEKEREQQEAQYIKVIREHNPEIFSIRIKKVWRQKPFAKSQEITILTKDEETGTYSYFDIRKDNQSGDLKYLGKQERSEPVKNADGEYVLPNQQKNVHKQDAADVLEKIQIQNPELKDKPVVKIVEREFPSGEKRTTVIYREQSKTVQYVVLKDQHERLVIEEVLDYEVELEALDKVIKDEIELIQGIEADVDYKKKVQDKQHNQKQIKLQNLEQIRKKLIELRPELQNSTLVKAWERKPSCGIVQLTSVVKLQNGNTNHCFLSKNKAGDVKLIGCKQVSQSDLQKKELPHPGKQVSLHDIDKVLQKVYKTNSDCLEKTILSSSKRTFPNSNRFEISIRMNKSIEQFVITETEGTFYLEANCIEIDGLKDLQAKVEVIDNKGSNENPTKKPDTTDKQAAWENVKDKKNICEGVKTVLVEKTSEKIQSYVNFGIFQLQSTPEVIPSQKTPVKTFANTFCDYEQVVTVFRNSPSELTYLQFREKISTKKKEFMGMERVTIDPTLPNADITDVTIQQINPDKLQEALNIIFDRFPRLQNQQLQEVSIRRFQRQLRYSVLLSSEKKNEIDERFIVVFNKNGKSVVEECRIKEEEIKSAEKKKPIKKVLEHEVITCQPGVIEGCVDEVINKKEQSNPDITEIEVPSAQIVEQIIQKQIEEEKKGIKEQNAQKEKEEQKKEQKKQVEKVSQEEKEKERDQKLVKEQKQKQNIGRVESVITHEEEGEVSQIETKPRKELEPELKKINDYLSKIVLGTENEEVVGVEQRASQTGTTIVLTKQNKDNTKVDRHYIYKDTQSGETYYLGSWTETEFNPNKRVLEKETETTKEESPELWKTALELVKNKKNQKYKQKETKKVTHTKYPKGTKLTIYFEAENEMTYGTADILIDSEGKTHLLKYTEKPVEIIKKQLTIQENKLPTSIYEGQCSVEAVLDSVYGSHPQLRSMQMKDKVVNQLPHTSNYELNFLKKTENQQKSVSVVAKCSLIDNQIRIEIASYTEKESVKKNAESIEQIIKEVQQKEKTEYSPVDPNVVYYPEATKLLESIPKAGLDEEVDLEKMSDELKEVIYYLRIKYEIVRTSTVIKVIKNVKTSVKQCFRVNFFVAPSPSHPSYRVYESVACYSTQTGQPKINVQQFRLSIDESKLVNDIAEQEQQEDVDIAYGYKKMDLVEVNHNADMKVIRQQIDTRYADIIANTELIEVEYLELKDNRVNYRITFASSSGQKLKFVVFYQPNLQRVLVLNAISNYKNNSAKELSSEDQAADITLQKILQTYLPKIHNQQMAEGNYKIQCVGVAQNQEEGKDYHIQVLNQAADKRYRSLVRTDNSNEYRQISWNQLIEISLDHYRLDENEKAFILNFQKLTAEELKTNAFFKLVYSYVKHQKQQTSSASLLGAASKPSGLGFLYKIFFRKPNGNLLQAEVYIESYSQKITLKAMKTMNFAENFILLKTNDVQIDKVVKALKAKVSIEGSYIVQKAQAKSFLYGNIYKLTVQLDIQGRKMLKQGLLYHDHSSEQLHLLYWKQSNLPQSEQGKCLVFDEKGSNCLKCVHNAPIVNGKCSPGVAFCESYFESQCVSCEDGFLMVNGVCTKDCGPLCDIVVLR